MKRTVFLIATAFAAGFLAAAWLLPRGAASRSVAASLISRTTPQTARNQAPLADVSHAPKSTATLVAEFQAAAKDPNTYHRAGRIAWLSDGLTPENAKAVVTAVLRDMNDIERDAILADLFRGWGRVDPAAAIAFARQLPREQESSDALYGALSGWVGKDFDAAADWVNALPAGNLKRNAGAWITSALAESDADRALDLTSGKSRFGYNTDGMLSDIMHMYIQQHGPEAAAERATALPQGGSRAQAMRAVADYWCGSDQEAALAWINALPDNPLRTDLYQTSIGQWMMSDFDSALAWLQKLPPGATRSQLVQRLNFQIANDDPANALKLIGLAPNSERQDQMLREIARLWGGNSPDTALEWARSQTESGTRAMIMENVIEGLSNENPRKAAELVAQIPEARTESIVNEIAVNWSESDPEAAAKWAASMTDSKLRASAVDGAMARWLDYDPPGAMSWFATLPAGPARDEIFQQFDSRLISSNPKLAMQWAQAIQDPGARRGEIKRLVDAWMNADPNEARTWLESSDLDPAVKKRFLPK